MSLPMPSFYDPSRVGELYLERAGLIAEEAARYAAAHRVRPALEDRLRIAAFGIDCQVGFCTPGASLFVPGAVEDMQRAVGWLYRNLDRITGLHFSMDTHRVFQVFHPAWWLDDQGRHPAPFTAITADDVRQGRYRPISHPLESLEYVSRLEKTGKYVLTIWPYHTLLGGLSHALVPAMMECALFHALCRTRQTWFETKGTHALTENYSVLSPEVVELRGQPVGSFNTSFFQMLMEYDRIYIFGEASSHCVLSTVRDLLDRIQATDPGLVDKVWLLEDAMSPVPAPPISPLPPGLDFPAVARQALEGFRKAGMHIARTTDDLKV